MTHPGWTTNDEAADTLPAPAEPDAATRWASEFMQRASGVDHVLAISLADDFATAGDL